jgi:hypothetical protein
MGYTTTQRIALDNTIGGKHKNGKTGATGSIIW